MTTQRVAGLDASAPPSLPELYYPFESRLSPHAIEVEGDNWIWLKRHGLLSSPAASTRVRAAEFGKLAARAYPEASLETLRLAAAWASWLFLRDDRCDEEGLGTEPALLKSWSDEHLRILAGTTRKRSTDPLAMARSDLGRRLLAKGGTRWMVRFLSDVQDYFEGSVWEAENRKARRVPALRTYIRLRDVTGAVKTCFHFYELSRANVLPIQARQDPALTRLMTLANRVICWSNDLFSAEKELAQGDVHNLVIVLQNHLHVSSTDATQHAVRMHDAAVRAFIGLQERFLKSNTEPSAAAFVTALEGWMRANVDWSVETGRYRSLAS